MSPFLHPAAESAFVWYLDQIVVRGRLTLHSPTQTYDFGQFSPQGGEVSSEVRVHDAAFFLRTLVSPSSADLTFAEAYIRGDVSMDTPEDLTNFVQIFILNRDKPLPSLPAPLTAILSIPAAVLSFPTRLVTQLLPTNRLISARRNISAHYDLGNEMFKAFLSRDMTYSCAIFPSLDADLKLPGAQTTLNGTDETAHEQSDALYDAQIRKLQHIIRKADIRPGHRVLEIGSGWGSLALLIARTIPNTTVDTITLSAEQAARVRELIQRDRREAAGAPQTNGTDASPLTVDDRVRVHLMDFRALPQEWEGAFDRVVSVEMVEAIGRDMYEAYFGVIEWALKKDTGVGVVQSITIPEARYDVYVQSEDFIRKWVLFPGGILPTITQLTSAVSSGSSQRLIVDSVSNIGPHYARTLREWRRRFEHNFGDIEKALKDKYPEAMNDTEAGREEIAMFRRKWIYYFCYCEAGFTTRTLGDHIITFTREGNVEYGCQTFL